MLRGGPSPGRQSPRSSAFAPESTASKPLPAASAERRRRARSCSGSSGRGRSPGSPRARARRRDRLVGDADRRATPRRRPARPSRGPARRPSRRASARRGRGRRAPRRERSRPRPRTRRRALEGADPGFELLDRSSCPGPRASASAQTDFTARPVDCASAAQSSCSGATFTTRPSSSPTDPDGAAGELDDALLPLELVAVETGHPHAERRRLLEHRRREAPSAPGRASAESDEPRPSLLHQAGTVQTSRPPPRSSARRRPERARRRGRRDSSRAGRRAVRSRSLSLSEHDPDDVRPVGEVAVPAP